MPEIERITDFNAPELDAIARMTENQLINREDPANGMFIAETALVIRRALAAGYLPVSIFIEERLEESLGREFAVSCPDAKLYKAPLEVLKQLTGYNITRGIIAVMKRKPLSSAEELCRGARRIAVLEEVMNPTNVGAIMRSAAALNIDAVLLTQGCSNPLYRRAIRVSMGTVFQVPWTFFGKDENYSERLHEMGFKTAAMALKEDSLQIYDERLLREEKLAVIMGTEGEGLAPATIAACDYTVKIPMTHDVDSLNVAAASAVAFYQLALLSKTD